MVMPNQADETPAAVGAGTDAGRRPTVVPYPSGGHRLAFLNLAGDLRGACTSAVKIGVGCLDGDHHRG